MTPHATCLPPELGFIIKREEAAALRRQFGTLKLGRGQPRKCLPLAFQLTQDEWAALTRETATLEAAPNLRSQKATSKAGGGIRSQFATASKRNIRYLPLTFTEHDALRRKCARP